LRKLNGFDESFFFYSEEVDLCYRFKKSGGKIYFYPQTKIYHFGSVSTNNNLSFRFINLSKAKIQYFKKHFNKLNFVLIVLFHYLGIILRIPIYYLGGIILFNKDYRIKAKNYFLQLKFSIQHIFQNR